jgi:hypothetical protein
MVHDDLRVDTPTTKHHRNRWARTSQAIDGNAPMTREKPHRSKQIRFVEDINRGSEATELRPVDPVSPPLRGAERQY